VAADDLVLVGVRRGEDLVGGDAWADRRVETSEPSCTFRIGPGIDPL
jgi:hypothetical protein